VRFRSVQVGNSEAHLLCLQLPTSYLPREHLLTTAPLSAKMSSSTSHSRQSKPDVNLAEWYPQFQSCYRYFLDHAQHSTPVQALAAYMNIRLPYQRSPDPVISSASASPSPTGAAGRAKPPSGNNAGPAQVVSLLPYIRRLVATGHDSPEILRGFFGEDWVGGIGSLHDVERRNYLFAAKSTSWMKVKQAYDLSPDESCPFLTPLREATEDEIQAAEATWSEWLAMQDWMLGPRSPEIIKRKSR